MTIPKSIVYSIVILAMIVIFPFLLFTGIFFIGNVLDMQFGSDFILEGLSLVPLIIPTVSLIVLIRLKKDSDNYNKVSSLLLFLNGTILCLGIFGIVYFLINPFSM